MEGYVQEALVELLHKDPNHHFYGLSKIEQPDYGAKVQYVKEDKSKPLNPNRLTLYKELWGSSYI